MGHEFPYQRWLQVRLSPLELFRYWLHRPKWMLLRWRRAVWFYPRVYPWLGEPIHDRRISPWAAYAPETQQPIRTDQMRVLCRTRHGVVVLYWLGLGKRFYPKRARNALLPGGRRGEVYNRGSPGTHPRDANVWRRKGNGNKIWLWGRVEITADDVVFIDAESQDQEVTIPDPDSPRRLERDIALHPPFVEALADDKFAWVAHGMLHNLDWIPVGSREPCRHHGFHGLIASLRNKGEDHLDFELGDPPRMSAAERTAHMERVQAMMRSIGWRTYSPAELAALARKDFQGRIQHRLEAWRSLDTYEARAADSHARIETTLWLRDVLLYEGDNPAWLEALSDESRIAVSDQFLQRLNALAATGRITRAEYDALYGK